MENEVLVEKKGHTFYITLNRPRSLNALTLNTMAQLHDAVEEYKADEDAFVAIVTGNGRAFCAGADLIDWVAERTPEEERDRARLKRQKGDFIGFSQECWKPIIVGVHGVALGGGFEIAISCDIFVATSDARLGTPEAKRGLAPGIAMIKLPRQIPLKVAMEIMLTGEDRFPVQRAYDLGLVNKVVQVETSWSDDQKRTAVLTACEEIAAKMLDCAPLSLQAIKQAAVRSRTIPLREAMHLDFLDLALNSEDAKEGPRAFAEKRKPRWTGS
ncbi:MAG: enoyl-CoA hydratase [Chloroflexota bacterium]|nr:MAG: enoyl-CoA hydratase [Chloroflexota bacterium]